MQPRLTPDGPDVIVAQGRLIDAVADGIVLFGTGNELASRIGVSTEAFRLALDELTAARWIVAIRHPDDRFTVRWERRQRQMAIDVDRRRPDVG